MKKLILLVIITSLLSCQTENKGIDRIAAQSYELGRLTYQKASMIHYERIVTTALANNGILSPTNFKEIDRIADSLEQAKPDIYSLFGR